MKNKNNKVQKSPKTKCSSNNKVPIKTRIKTIVVARAESTSLHGLDDLVKSDTLWKKILWTTFPILCLVLFLSLAIKRIDEYFSYPVSTSIRFINEKEIDFPGVAICNTNPFVTEKSVDFLVKFVENQTNLSYESNSKNQSKLQFLRDHFVQNTTYAYLISNLVYYNYSEVQKKSFGFPIENMIIDCKFDGIKCNQSDWTWFYTFNNGNCYLFNADNPKRISSINKNNGLSFELFAGHEESIPFFQKTSGFQIFVFNHSKYLQRESYIPRTSIQLGSEVNIEIKRRFILKLPRPYSECDIDLRTATVDSVDSDLYRELFLTNKSYEQFFCFHRAYRRTVFNKCGCVVEQSDVKTEARICSTKKEQDCRIHVDKVLYKKRRFNGEFDSQCPLECNANELEMKISCESFPSYFYGEYLFENNINFNRSNLSKKFDLKSVQRSVSKINIYYIKIGHEVLEESASMTVVDLLASLGGMLGLFLGMSILTFVVGAEFLIEILILMFKESSF